MLIMHAEWDGASPSRRRRPAPDLGRFIQQLNDEIVDYIWRQFTYCRRQGSPITQHSYLVYCFVLRRVTNATTAECWPRP